VHAGGALRGRGGQHQPADDGRPGQRDLLRDEAADGEPQQVNLAEVHCGEERDGVAGHLLDGARRCAAGAADSGVVDGDDPPGQGQRVDQRGIPVVEVPAEVLEQDQRHATLATAGVAVRIVDAVGRADQLVRKACIGSHHGIPSLVIVTN
jgi:hypothetical protein